MRVCLKFRLGRRVFLMFATQSSKRARRPPARFERVCDWLRSLLLDPLPPLPLPLPPPKSPQLSDTESRSASIPGGDTTWSHTRPRSSLIDEMRSS